MDWNPLKKQTDPQQNRIDELADSLAQSGRFDELEAALEKLNKADLNAIETEAWHHLFGICAFRRQDHALAEQRFRQGLEACPDSHALRFSLGQEYLFLGQPAKAFSLFDECAFPQPSAQLVMAMSRYAYLFSEYGRGIKYLEAFFDIFQQVKILDDTFLYMRGLPFFHEVWATLAAHCVLSDRQEHLRQVTSNIKGACHDFDADFLDFELAAIIDNDFTPLIAPLEKRLADRRQEIGSSGFLASRLAIYKSFNAGSFDVAMQIFSAVELGADDFAWLPDILALAMAKAANRFGRVEQEAMFLEPFMQRQPLLFEPEHAVTFGLLDYQETLKPRVAIVQASL